MSVSDDEIRAGDADRERAVEVLRRATVEGKLTMEEFTERTDTAMASRTRGQLARLTADLGGSSVAQSWQAPPPPLAPQAPVITSRISAVMGENQRFGRWRAEGRLEVKSIMGSCKIDLRSAEIVGPLLDIHVSCVMGEAKIFVPRGLDIRFEMKNVMGSCKDIRDNYDILPGSPVIRISGTCVMGNVEVLSRQPGMLEEWKRKLMGDEGQ